MSRIIARSEWGARAPKARHTIDLPTPKLYLHHSAGSGADGAAVRAIQKFHMDPPPAGRGWNDIAYSFLIDDDPQTPGDVFEGRGAGIAGGHTAGQNTISHGICVVGNFQTRRPRDETLNTLVGLVAHGHRQGWWPDRITGGHRDAPGAATSCPGDTLHRLIPQINSEVQRTLKGGRVLTKEQADFLNRMIATAKNVGTNAHFLAGIIPAYRQYPSAFDAIRRRLDIIERQLGDLRRGGSADVPQQLLDEVTDLKAELSRVQVGLAKAAGF